MRRRIAPIVLVVLFAASFLLASSPAWASEPADPTSTTMRNPCRAGTVPLIEEWWKSDVVPCGSPEQATTTTTLEVPAVVGGEDEEPPLNNQDSSDEASSEGEELPFTGTSSFLLLAGGGLLIVGLAVFMVAREKPKH